MSTEQEMKFDNWWNTWYKSTTDITVKEAAREAWCAAIDYQQTKENREFRWDGVIR
jgi:hypothetical protein